MTRVCLSDGMFYSERQRFSILLSHLGMRPFLLVPRSLLISHLTCHLTCSPPAQCPSLAPSPKEGKTPPCDVTGEYDLAQGVSLEKNRSCAADPVCLASRSSSHMSPPFTPHLHRTQWKTPRATMAHILPSWHLTAPPIPSLV